MYRALHAWPFYYWVVGLGVWMTFVHLHCYYLSCSSRPDISPPISGPLLTVFLVVLVFAQTHVFQNLLFAGRVEFELMMDFGSVFKAHDVLLIQPRMTPQDWRRGDIVMGHGLIQPEAEQVLVLERVYALPCDRIAIKAGRVVVNGKPVSGEIFTPLTVGNRNIFVPLLETAAVATGPELISAPEVTVPAETLGIILGGRIVLKPMAACRGAVEAITYPPDRARRLRD